ncbi:outer membrane protein assembly factor [Myxococcota bacterium]|nr:outer membrane protein assembly factor [Myxococcota bacterium]
MRRGLVSLVIAAAVSIANGSAWGETTVTSTRAGSSASVATSTRAAVRSDGAVTSTAAPSPERALPDYDGRGDDPGTVGDALLWGPRVVLFPAWLVSEYVVRRPLEWLVVNAEKYQWPTLVLDFFTFGEERWGGIVPTALFDFGLRASIGVYAFFDDVAAESHDVRLYAAYGGPAWYAARLTNRYTLPDDSRFALTIGATRRPDYPFHGIGPLTNVDFAARYRSDRVDVVGSYDAPIGDAGSLRLFTGLRRVAFREGSALEEPSLGELVDERGFPAPPGFRVPYSLVDLGVEVALDSRRPRPGPGSGVRFELSAHPMLDLEDALGAHLAIYGGALGGFVDLDGRNRVVSLFVSARTIDPLGKGGLVPFTELLSIGGTGPLTGFIDGALIGRSTLAARLEYRWPIWGALDGTLHFAVGNVFGPRWEDVRPELMRMSFGLGIRTVGRPDHAFTMLVALGTEPFEQGADVTSLRFAIGTTRGF